MLHCKCENNASSRDLTLQALFHSVISIRYVARQYICSGLVILFQLSPTIDFNFIWVCTYIWYSLPHWSKCLTEKKLCEISFFRFEKSSKLLHFVESWCHSSRHSLTLQSILRQDLLRGINGAFVNVFRNRNSMPSPVFQLKVLAIVYLYAAILPPDPEQDNFRSEMGRLIACNKCTECLSPNCGTCSACKRGLQKAKKRWDITFNARPWPIFKVPEENLQSQGGPGW